MKQRIIAILLALTLLVTVGVVAVSATGETPTVEETIAAAYVCPCHGTPIAEITDWVTFSDGVILEDGKHYQLSAGVTLTSNLTSNYYVISSGKMLIDLNGKAINSKTASHRAFQINAGAELTVIDQVGGGSIKGGGNGGNAIVVNGKLNLFDALLANRRSTPATSPGNGGVVNIGSGAVFNMYSGTLTPDTNGKVGAVVKKGGAVFVAGGGEFNLYSGTVNAVTTATGSGNGGDAIYIGSSTAKFTMYGGTVNPAKTASGQGLVGNNGVYTNAHIKGGVINGDVKLIYTTNTISVSGDPVIQEIDVTKMTDEEMSGIVIGEGGLTGGRIGIEAKADTPFTSLHNTVDVASSAKYFYSNTFRSNAATKNADGRLVLTANNYCEHCEADATWTAWSGGVSTFEKEGASGHYYLNKYITSGGQAKIGKDAASDGSTAAIVNEICLDMYGQQAIKEGAYRIFAVYAGSTLNLMNSTSLVSTLQDAYTDTGANINLAGASNLNLYDGMNFVSTGKCSNGGNIQVGSGTFTMYGSTLNGGNSSGGGAVYVISGNFIMEGGTINGYDIAKNGGAVGVGANGEFTMNGGTITGGKADCGGNLYIAGAFTMNGGTISAGTAATDGGNIYADEGASLVVTGGTINGGTASGNGGAIFATGEGTSVQISGGAIYGGKAPNGSGGAIAVTEGGALTIEKNAVIDGGTAKTGGAIYLNNDGALGTAMTMTGGTVQNGKTLIGATSYYGGNLYIGKGADVEISGGTIKDGTAYADGGNIFQLASAGELKISGNAMISGGMITYYKVTNGELTTNLQDKTNTNYGGGNIYIRGTTTISGNAQIIGAEDPVTNCGANIYVRGTLNVEGGTITGGDATYQADCIAVRNQESVNISGGSIDSIAIIRNDKLADGTAYDNGTITVSGAPVIGNIDLTSYTSSGYLITLGALTNNASIGVTAAEGVAFTAADAALAEASKGYFHDAVNTLSVDVLNDCLVLIVGPKMAVCPHCGYNGEWTDLNATSFVTVEGSHKGLPGGHYYLSENFSTGTRVVVNANSNYNSDKLCIDLNGHTYKQTGSTHAFWIRSTSGDLAIMDLSADKNGMVTSGYSSGNATGSVVYMTNGEFSLYSGTLKSTGSGVQLGGVIGSKSGNVIINIKGGTVTGGKAEHGGNIYASTSGAQINISGDAVITGGQVTNEDTIPRGGNIFCGGTFTMTGGTISDGTTTSSAYIPRGGNVYLDANKTHTISGGTITGGTANNGNGGNVYVFQGSLTVSNAIISNGTATRPLSLTNGGGNIYCYAGTVLDVQSGTISGGETVSLGGNILSRGTVTIANRDILSGGIVTNAMGIGQELFGNGATLAVTDLGEAWDGDIILTNDAVIANNTIGVATAIYNEGRAYDVWYASVENAQAADTEGENTYLALTLDGTYDLSGHVVDIRGYNVTVNGAAACFDSSNDDYEGYGIATLNKAPQTSYIAPSGNLYITVAEGNGKYSFHRLNMTMEYANVRSSVGGVYYTAKWNADNVLAGDLKADTYNPIVYGYGIALTKGDVALENFETQGAFTYFDNMEGFTNNFLYNARGKEINSCVLKNIVKTTNSAAQNLENAETVINAAPFVYFKAYTGEIVPLIGDASSYSYMQLIEGAAAIPEMAEKVQSLCENWFLGTENYKIGPDVDAAKYPNLYALLNPAEA